MVQKAFLSLILADMEQNYLEGPQQGKARYDASLMSQMAAKNFKNSDAATNTLLMKHFGGQWRDRCERGLLLAKQLGNIYTGSLYNGLLSLICDETIDLTGKKILMFSYGSGCAASMFVLKVNQGYRRVQQISSFKQRLASRVKVSPAEYERWMEKRERSFGQANIVPEGSIDHLENGTYYLTRIDEKFIRYYAIKGQDDGENAELRAKGSHSPRLPRTSQAA